MTTSTGSPDLGNILDAIFKKRGMTKGTVAERIQGLYKDPSLFFSNDAAGKAKLIAYCNERLDAVSETNRMHSCEISGRSLGNIARPDCGNERIRNGMSRSRPPDQQRITTLDQHGGLLGADHCDGHVA